MSELKDFSGKKVLYIDDTPVNLMTGTVALEGFNIEVHTGSNMAELFELVRKNEYDLIFLDDMMPEKRISGTNGMKQLRAQGYKKPIVVLTANNSPVDRASYLKAGFDDHISKPINVEELENVLKKFLH